MKMNVRKYWGLVREISTQRHTIHFFHIFDRNEWRAPTSRPHGTTNEHAVKTNYDDVKIRDEERLFRAQTQLKGYSSSLR